MGFKTLEASRAHNRFRKDIVKVLQKHQNHLTPMELLAVVSHLVGQLIALQDQRKVTRDEAIDIVKENMEAGNAEAIDAFLKTPPKGTA